MRRYEISPAIVAAMRRRAAASFREAGVPLQLDLPRYGGPATPAYHEVDAEDGRIEADGFLFDPEEDDDFY